VSRKQREEERVRGIFGRRALALGLGQMGLLGFLAHRLHRLQVDEGERYATLAEENRLSARLLAPPRGRVLDRAGQVIAGNQLNWRALLTAEQTVDVAATLQTFSRIVPLTEAERARIERDVRRRRRFVPVVVREFLSWEDMARIELNAPDLPGIGVDVGTTRIYPEGEHLAHIVGYVAPPAERDMDGDPLLELPGIRVGRSGIERHHDLALRGRAGAVQMEVNAVGRIIRELDRREGVQGQDVQLSVDAALTRTLRGKIEEGTSVVLMDARNGRCWRWRRSHPSTPTCSTPAYRRAVARMDAQPRTPLINKATNGLYAPGSTFKMVVALAALDARVVTPGDRVHCPGHMDLGDARFHCWHRPGHGGVGHAPGAEGLLRRLLLRDGQAHRHRPDRRHGRRFGLGVPLGDRAAGHPRGLVPTRAWRQAQGKAWALGDTVVHGSARASTSSRPVAGHHDGAAGDRAGGATASDAQHRRAAGARDAGGGLAEPWHPRGQSPPGAGGDVGGGERGRRHRARRPHPAGDGGGGRQDRHHAGSAGDAGTARTRLQCQPGAAGMAAACVVRRLCAA
jgi:penicillin-binding protein 2